MTRGERAIDQRVINVLDSSAVRREERASPHPGLGPR